MRPSSELDRRCDVAPAIELAERLPWLGDNIKAVEAVARASEQSANAGLAMVDAAIILDWQDVRVPATEAFGAVDFCPARRDPELDEVAKGLGIAEAQLAAADTGRLVGPIATGYHDALDTVRRRYKIASHTRDLAHLLPGFLGAGGSRTYLMAVQTLGLPQGTGGRVDLVGTLVAERGTITLDGPLVPAGEAFADANVTPDGPTTAQELLRIASTTGLGEVDGRALDGVVLVDSVWLQDALWVTGQVEVPGRRKPLTMDDAAMVLEGGLRGHERDRSRGLAGQARQRHRRGLPGASALDRGVRDRLGDRRRATPPHPVLEQTQGAGDPGAPRGRRAPTTRGPIHSPSRGAPWWTTTRCCSLGDRSVTT